jgi:hypothetical protein
VKGETTGWTCPACPQHGEPIRRVVNGAGVRCRVTLDAGETPTGKRRQESKLLNTLADARSYVTTRTAEMAKAKAEGRVIDRTKMTVNGLMPKGVTSARSPAKATHTA